MMKRFLTFLLSLLLALPVCSLAEVTFVSSEAEYDSFINKIISLIALRQELSSDLKDEKRIGDSDRVLHEIERIENELDMLGVDWRSFLPGKRGRSGKCGAFMKNTFCRPTVQIANLPRHLRKLMGKPTRACDITAQGEVLDSAFFINRDIDSYSSSDIARIDSMSRPRGRITLIKENVEGKLLGFFGEDGEGNCFFFRIDPPGTDEQVTGAVVIGSTIARLMGYNVPVSTIITVNGTGDARFDGRRAVATKLLPGDIGGWSYYSFCHRRELRATKVLAAWINNTGLVDHNTLVRSFRVGNVDLYRYYICNFGNSLGSAGSRSKLPKEGWEHSLDLSVTASTPLRWVLKPFGVWRERYKRGAKPIDSVVGLFDANVNPDLYEAEYPNMAWRYMTTEDALWAVDRISRFTPEHIEAIVALAGYSDPGNAEYIQNILLERRKKIMEHYLGRRVM